MDIVGVIKVIGQIIIELIGLYNTAHKEKTEKEAQIESEKKEVLKAGLDAVANRDVSGITRFWDELRRLRQK